MVPPGIEPGTQGFSVLCSTNWAMAPTLLRYLIGFATAKVTQNFNSTNFLLKILKNFAFSLPQRPIYYVRYRKRYLCLRGRCAPSLVMGIVFDTRELWDGTNKTYKTNVLFFRVSPICPICPISRIGPISSIFTPIKKMPSAVSPAEGACHFRFTPYSGFAERNVQPSAVTTEVATAAL